jgi:hypothetical protein
MRTYGLLEVILNGKFQAGLVARPQLGGASFDVSQGVDRTDGVDYVLPGSGRRSKGVTFVEGGITHARRS